MQYSIYTPFGTTGLHTRDYSEQLDVQDQFPLLVLSTSLEETIVRPYTYMEVGCNAVMEKAQEKAI